MTKSSSVVIWRWGEKVEKKSSQKAGHTGMNLELDYRTLTNPGTRLKLFISYDICNRWVTPAFQRKKFRHREIKTVLGHIVSKY